MLRSGAGAGVVVVLLALSRPCTLARNSSRIKTLFFLVEEVLDSVEELGEGEDTSVVDGEEDEEGGGEPAELPSVEVAASVVVDEAGAFSLLLKTEI